MKRIVFALIAVFLCIGSAFAQVQTLEETDSLKTRRQKENANFVYLSNQITTASLATHSHINKSFLDALPASLSNGFLHSDGVSIGFSVNGSSLTHLNGNEITTGTIASNRLPAMGASGINHAAGLVPDPGSSSGTARFLREDASFAVPVLSTLGGVLGSTQGGTGFSAFAIGDLFYADTANHLARLGIGTNGQRLTVNAGVPVWADPGGGSSHALLSATHTDTEAASVVRGDLMVGQGASPLWKRLPIGAAGSVLLTNDGVDVSYAKIVNANISSSAAIDWSKVSKTGSSIAHLGDVVISSPSNLQVLQFNGTNWVNQTLSGSGITSLNGLTGASQAFSVDSTGTDFSVTSSSATHSFHMPSASATARGLMSTGSQAFAGDKQFNNNLLVLGSLTVGGGAAVGKILMASASLDFPTTNTGATTEVAITVTGAATGDPVFLGVPSGAYTSSSSADSYEAYVSSVDTVRVRYTNLTGTGRNPNPGTFTVVVFHF